MKIDLARVNTTISGLLRTHRQALAVKGILDERALRNILCCDFEKLLHALVEAQSVRVDELLSEVFFADQPELAREILAGLTDNRLNHVGFEIFEPLDLVLQGIDYWVESLNRDLGRRIRIHTFLRFPASQSFQRRVKAAVEILCIALQVDGQILVLELFDIAHPLEAVPLADQRTVHHLKPQTVLAGGPVSRRHRQAMRHFFANDSIWHYSIHLNSREEVQCLHQRFQALSAQVPHYRLAYAVPVENLHDGSFHTKLINQVNGLELEFCNLRPAQKPQSGPHPIPLALLGGQES